MNDAQMDDLLNLFVELLSIRFTQRHHIQQWSVLKCFIYEIAKQHINIPNTIIDTLHPLYLDTQLLVHV